MNDLRVLALLTCSFFLTGASFGEEGAVELGLLTSHPSPEVRLEAVRSLRALQAQEVDRFLNDPVAEVRAAAVRAIYDESIVQAFPQLARITPRIARSVGEQNQEVIPLARRAMAASWKLGRTEDLAMMMALVREKEVVWQLRKLAAEQLRQWNEVLPEELFLDRRTGFLGNRILLTKEALAWLPACLEECSQAPEQEELLESLQELAEHFELRLSEAPAR